MVTLSWGGSSDIPSQWIRVDNSPLAGEDEGRRGALPSTKCGELWMQHPGQAGASWGKKDVTSGVQERVKAIPKGLEHLLHEEELECFGVSMCILA